MECDDRNGSGRFIPLIYCPGVLTLAEGREGAEAAVIDETLPMA